MPGTLQSNEILIFEPRLRASFEPLMPEGSSFGSEMEKRVFDEGRALLSKKFCPYCCSPVHKEDKSANAMNRGWGIQLPNCINCGWWAFEEINTPVGGEPDQDFSEETWGYNFVEGVLRTFRADDLSIPVHLLREYAVRNPKVLYELHPRKFEELVAAILKDFFACEVRLTGQTVDGGVDIYLIRGETQYLVQVKRRSQPGATEGVQVIRELAGVLLISGQSKGIVVSTADKFSNTAKREASSQFLQRRGFTLDLMDCRSLLNTLNVVCEKEGHVPLWKELLRRPLQVSVLKYVLEKQASERSVSSEGGHQTH
jgi:hypothetical protein